VRQPLRRHRALRALVGRTRAIGELHLLAAEHGAGDMAKRRFVDLARAAADHADALDRKALAIGLVRQQPVDARANGASVVARMPGPVRPTSSFSASRRLQFLAVEPEARQFEALGFVGGVMKRRLVAVAVERRAERIAQERDVAIYGRARTPEFVDQARQRHRIARGFQNPVQGRDAFVAVHAAMVREARAEQERCPTRFKLA
jgi:hypothetical protein